MRIVRAKDYQDMSEKAAHMIAEQIRRKPDCVLGLATGSTPEGIYEKLAEWYRAGKLDFARVTTVNLDEYKGLDRGNVHSYYHYMQEKLFARVNIRTDRTFVPDGMAQDSDRACREYDGIIAAAGGVDLQLLGLGHNGHIGFNEPGTDFEIQTHCVNLTESTVRANRRFFSSMEEVPGQAYTMGIGTIMQAAGIVMAVSGEDKAEILKTAVCGPVTTMVPASVLQLHRNVTIIADEAALSLVGNDGQAS